MFIYIPEINRRINFDNVISYYPVGNTKIFIWDVSDPENPIEIHYEEQKARNAQIYEIDNILNVRKPL